MKEVQWRWDYGVYVPFCPYCDEPAYDKDKCCFCGKHYKWLDSDIKDTVVEKGEYTIVQRSNNHVHIYKDGRMIYHASCTKKMTAKELLDHVVLLEVILNEETESELKESEK